MLTSQVNPILRPKPKAKTAKASATLIKRNLRFERRHKREEQLDATRLRRALEHIDRLPQPGWAMHCVFPGNFNGWDFIPAVLRLIQPATLRHLAITTLSFNKRNSSQLLELIDSGAVARADLVASIFFEQAEGNVEMCAHLASELRRRGSRFATCRNHTKVICAETTDHRHYVIESSCNLRSCGNLEQLTIFHDAGLLEFHAAWIGGLLDS
ncbi:MAG: hypothetical protein GTO62_01445 [Planctomycetales bacterium]|nr:hypothetical protein [Planctomycetales bacterium]NIP67891.1 hypothetical protein [Planctomycetales bacterium]